MKFEELGSFRWSKVEPHLPQRSEEGKPRAGDRESARRGKLQAARALRHNPPAREILETLEVTMFCAAAPTMIYGGSCT